MTTDRSPRPGRARRAPAATAVLVALALGLGLIAATPVTAPAQQDPGAIDADQLREEYEELVGAEADLLVSYDLSTARLEQLLVDVAEAQAANEAAEAALVDAETDLATRREEEAAAERAVEAAEDDVAEAEAMLRRFAVGAYMAEGAVGDLSDIVAMLEGEDQSLVRSGYRQSVDDQQGRAIDLLVEARAERTRLEEQAEQATADAARQRDDVDALRAEAAASLADATRLAREAAEERDRQAQLIVDIQSRRVAIETRIVSLNLAADGVAEALASFQAADPPWTPGALHFQSPLPCTPISSEFGPRAHPILSITRLHAGADIGASTGEPVQAAADGIVLISAARGGYGNTVVIAHGFSLGTVYAHNSELLVQPGQQVKRGDVVALAGSTGLSTGPHVHFETRVKGVPVNPRTFLLPSEGGTGLPGPPPPEEVERPGLSTTTTTTEPIGDC